MHYIRKNCKANSEDSKTARRKNRRNNLKILYTMQLKSIYDNGGKTLDRYTIVTDERRVIAGHKRKYLYECIGASENGLGVFMWGECVVGRHLGKKVELTDLSEELQNRIINALKD